MPYGRNLQITVTGFTLGHSRNEDPVSLMKGYLPWPWSITGTKGGGREGEKEKKANLKVCIRRQT